MMERRGRTALSLLGLILFFTAWEGLARSGLVSALLVPPPSRVPAAWIAELRAGTWFATVAASLTHYLAGLLVGSVAGITVGVATALSPCLDALLAWVVRTLRPIPAIAWVPFAIIWFGVSETAAAFIISITVFWLNFFATAVAVRNVDKDFIEMGIAFGQTSWPARLGKIVLPAASPGILGGLRSGLGQGWMSVVAAELFGIPGIGQRMMEASGLLATQVVVLYMLTIAALYGLTDVLFMLVQRKVLAWQR
jgi:NitT/TauT family transport system permease protein